MFRRNSEMHIHFSGLACRIQRTLHQMFFQRRTHTIRIPVEFQQSLRQCPIVQAGSFQQLGYDRFVILLRHQSVNILSRIIHTSRIQVIIECEAMNMIEKLLLEISLRSIVISPQEFEQILEHTAGGTRGGYKLHDGFLPFLICIPCFQISLHFISGGGHDAFLNRSGRIQFQEWEPLFKASQLLCNLLLGNSFFH